MLAIVAALPHDILRFYRLVVFLRPMIVTFLAAAVVTFLIVILKRKETLSFQGFVRHCFPWLQGKVKTTWVDALFFITSKFTQVWITFISSAIIIYATKGVVWLLGDLVNFHQKLVAGPVTVALVGLVLMIFADLGEYLSHATQHRLPVLWEFHKVHHSALFLTPLTTFRCHPIGNLVDGVFMGLAQVIPVAVAHILFGFSFLQLIGLCGAAQFVSSVLLLTTLQHSHFQISFGVLDRVVMSPLMHQVHHSVHPDHYGKNLGSRLAVWDWCFGTGVKPSKGEVIQYGLGTEEDTRGDYATFLWCYVGPAVHCFRIFKRAIGLRVNSGGENSPPAAPDAVTSAAGE